MEKVDNRQLSLEPGVDIVLVGLNHRSAPVEVREKLAFGSNYLCKALCHLREETGLRECGIISTCNRVEVYGTTEPDDDGLGAIEDFLSWHSGQPKEVFKPALYMERQPQSVRHIFRVTSGLDAMMVGEKEIVAQVKQAYEKALEAGSVGTVLNALFQKALKVSKRVRRETRIDAGAISVSSAAVELAGKIFGDLSDKAVMIVGAGQTGEQALKHLVDSGAGSVVASNRSHEKAAGLARKYGGRAVRLDDCEGELSRVDIVISSTSAPHPIIGIDQVRRAMKRRRNRPLFLIDIAVPRDVDPGVNDIDNVYVYNVDDLKEVAEANLRKRREEISKCDKILDEEVRSFMGWFNSLRAAPIIRKLHHHFESVRAHEVDKVLSNLPELSEEDRQKLHSMTRRMVKRLLHVPTTRIKKAARNKDAAQRLGFVIDLFGLEEKDQQGK